jgi:probable rRNA maturation factor
LSIKVYYDKINFRIHRTREIKKFLEKVIRDEKKAPGDLKFIFTSDKTEKEINRKFLGHNYYTDVISFDYSDGNLVSGEIYISADTLKKNAHRFHVSMKDEILRVMIHGTLHLCGYLDKDKTNRDLMFGMQERLLEEFKKEL